MSEGMATSVPTNMSNSAVAPAPTGGDGGAGGGTTFFDSIGSELSTKQWAQDFSKAEKPYEALAKAYDGAQSLLGKKSAGIEVPGEGATPEQIQAFHKALGVPEKADGYEYKMPDLSKEPEPLQKLMTSMRDEAFTAKMREAAHAAGLTPKQYEQLHAALDGHTIEQGRAAMERQAKALEEQNALHAKQLKELYGDAADSVQQIAKQVGEKVLPEAVRNTKDPLIMLVEMSKYIHEKVFSDDSVMKSGTSNGTSQTLREQIMEARKDPAFTDWRNPNHEEAKARVRQLYAMEAEAKRNKL